MSSNNKLFQSYLRRQSKAVGKRLTDIEFITECRNQWKLMSESDKRLHSNSNSNPKTPSPGLKPNQENCKQSVPSDDEELKEEIENKLIDGLVKYKSKENILNTKFFFMSTNIQCVVKKEYRPLEIGIIEFTLKDGIALNYHQFIDCGDVPKGYAFEAMDNMENSHKIPLKNFVEASNDYLSIGKQILKTLSDSCVDEEINICFNKPMIVFSQTEQIPQNKGALEWIAKKYNQLKGRDEQEINVSNIHVLRASKLLASLFSVGDECRSLDWCQNTISSYSFDYSLGTDCSFHEGIQCIYCAIGVPKRMAYVMSYILQKLYDIRLTAKHLPIVSRLENVVLEEDNQKQMKFISQLKKEKQIKEEELTEETKTEKFVFDLQIKKEKTNETQETDKGVDSEKVAKEVSPQTMNNESVPIQKPIIGVGRGRPRIK